MESDGQRFSDTPESPENAARRRGKPSSARATVGAVTVGLAEEERQALCDAMRRSVAELLVDLGGLSSLEEVERLTSELLVPAGLPDAPPELGVTVVEAIEAWDGPAAADLLHGLAALGQGEVREAARAAAGLVRAEPRFADQIGRIEMHAAALVEADGLEILQLRFRRGDGSFQLGALFIEHVDTGGAALDGQLTSPLPEPVELQAPDATTSRELSASEATRRARAALERSAELGIEVGSELGVCLPLLSLGLAGSPEALPRVAVEPPGLDEETDTPPSLYVDPLDEDAFELLARSLLGELEDWLVADGIAGPDAEELCFAAESALRWKWGYGGGTLGRWTVDDVAEYLLDFAPRKLPSDDATIAALPRALAELFELLEARGSLVGSPLAELLENVEELRPDYAEIARDPASWGLAKSLVAGMESEGVDPTDENAVNSWMEDFNARPLEERNGLLGPALEGMAETGPPVSRRPQPSSRERRGKRKAARGARRRNRR